MKVKDLLAARRDVDVFDNYTEDLAVAYCGAQLTEEGRVEYADVLELEFEYVGDDAAVALVMVDNDIDSEMVVRKKLRKAMDMFYGMAGYCSQEKFDKYFIA